MSIPVEIGDLKAALAEFGSGYLLTTADGRIKVVTVEPVFADTGLRVTNPGRGTLANLAGNAAVTLAFPPLEPRGYTLLVDGTGVVEGDDVLVVPANAVLHRPASHAAMPASAEGCGHDCAPVTGRTA